MDQGNLCRSGREAKRNVPLCDLSTGEAGTVVQIQGGAGFIGRMAALGFTLGATVSIKRNPGRGSMIVNVLDSQIALGRGQASRVLVRRGRVHGLEGDEAP
jgi:ferrous iron transport protein A